jgi:hypothetical protein
MAKKWLLTMLVLIWVAVAATYAGDEFRKMRLAVGKDSLPTQPLITQSLIKE